MEPDMFPSSKAHPKDTGERLVDNTLNLLKATLETAYEKEKQGHTKAAQALRTQVLEFIKNTPK